MLTGSIIGAGIFGIPYVSSRAGFWVGEAYIIGLLFLVIFLHLCYGEIVERTQEAHRIVGYARKYLGEKAERISFFLGLANGYMALLLYVIAAGKFVSIITFNAISPFWGSMLFWFLGTAILWRGTRPLAAGEFLMTGLLIFFIGFVVVRGASFVHFSNFTPFNPSQLFLPYGVILFSLTGAFAIPEMRLILSEGKKYAAAIIAGTAIPAVLYLIFNFVVVGMSGAHTSVQAIEGITLIAGEWVGWVGSLAGLLAIATSYFVFGLNLKHMLMLDRHISSFKSTFFIAGVPVILFLLGFQQFIAVMSVAGAVFGAAVSIIILLVYMRARRSGDRKPAFSLGIPNAIVYTIIAAMAGAGVYQIIYWIH